MLQTVRQYIIDAVGEEDFNVSYIENNNFGHVASNVAMVLAKGENKNSEKKNPVDLAKEIANKILKIDSEDDAERDEVKKTFSKIEVAGPGFINFTFSDEYLKNVLMVSTEEVLNNIKNKNINDLNGKEVLVEYTDPNPFKVFHIGHLMTNIIGESLASIYELSGANVKRINYQGDVGRHIAINIYAILKEENYKRFLELKSDDSIDIKKKVEWLGERYAEGYKDFDNEDSSLDDDENPVKTGGVIYQVAEINKKIYERSDEKINEIYDTGKSWSMEYFETLYKLLGTKFDKYIMESEAAPIGLGLVKENTTPYGKNIFETGDGGSIIYDGEKDNLHKRVFINKNGLPTYEAKDLGNMEIKLESYPNIEKSVVITAHEQSDYFKVLYKAIEKLRPELAGKLVHYGHGMMRFADGKMSSRKGNIIAGDELIENVKENIFAKFENSKIESAEEKNFVLEKVAIGAIKYAVLKQAIGRDVIFDIDKVVSVDGDSGPYLQYTHARFASVAKDMENNLEVNISDSNRNIIVMINKFEDVLTEVAREVAPQKLLTYLVELAREANSWYAVNRVVDNRENELLASKIKSVLSTGLRTLAIHAPERM